MQRIFGTRSVKTLKLFLVLLAGVLATSAPAYAIDLSVAPSAEELSTMPPMDVCRHFEVRETVSIKAAIASKGLKCGPILKNWAVLQEKQSLEDERQRQQQALERARQADEQARRTAEVRRQQEEQERFALERQRFEVEQRQARAAEAQARALQSQSQAAGLAQALRGLQQLQGRTSQPAPSGFLDIDNSQRPGVGSLHNSVSRGMRYCVDSYGAISTVSSNRNCP